MKILSIDTSSEACSVSLNIDGELSTRFEIAPQRHSSLVLNMCDDLLSNAQLSPAQLDAVAFGQGPGSFTGLRIAAGVTQGIAYGADIPVIKVSTLAALAQQIASIAENGKIVVALDARMHEVYWCIYSVGDNGLVVANSEEMLTAPTNLYLDHYIQADDTFYGIGSGWSEYQEELRDKVLISNASTIFENKWVSAEEIGILAANKFKQGELSKPADAIPVYLRNNVAKKSTIKQ